ncbi:hypothetical protein N7519_004011 [Penicillium mononematosum]|uniref:uncharacterized protein n=1 Tax=Penicillium mononematosum TaxID=268346 RepID=UPI002546E515|nr:uncharacterized protein N7519_004011 [Penicillium mononematosum]KAJ6189103.1 hypothetical protein N7519_004011 [Penicillium mononematosum]
MSSDYIAPNIDISDVKLVDIIKQTDRAFLCRARWQDKDCVLKVAWWFHPYKWDEIDPRFRSIDLLKNESRAYSGLKARGFCERGSVPDLYGVVVDIYPEAEGWQPELKKFYDRTFPQGLDPKARPNAHKLQELLTEIHEAGTVHLDPYPRNMLIQGDSDQVLWIDFELAQIFDPKHPRLFCR